MLIRMLFPNLHLLSDSPQAVCDIPYSTRSEAEAKRSAEAFDFDFFLAIRP